MAGKIIVCRCEDVTLADIEHALAGGHIDIEEVKRYTGLGTGPCQGKECLALCAEVLAQARGRDPEIAARWAQRPEAPQGEDRDQPFTARPPVFPVSLGALAGRGEGGAQ